MAFAYGYILPKPESSAPTVWVYAFEVLRGCEKKGCGTYLMAQLRTFFFYENACSDMFFLCDNENIGLYNIAVRSGGLNLKNFAPIFIPNENTDNNGNWLGMPEDGKVEINFNED